MLCSVLCHIKYCACHFFKKLYTNFSHTESGISVLWPPVQPDVIDQPVQAALVAVAVLVVSYSCVS